MDFTEVSSDRHVDFKKKKSKKKNVSGETPGECREVKVEEMEESEAAAAAAFPPTFSVSEIKNKQRRHLMFMKLKQEKRKVLASAGKLHLGGVTWLCVAN